MKPIWFENALKDAGTHEVDGKGNNPRIIEMFTHCSYQAKEDVVPWCAAAVCCWLEEVGIPSTHSAAAASFLEWGVELPEPREGCICVIQQRYKGQDKATGSSSGYHVGLWAGQSADAVTLFGGNQSDSVKYSNFRLNSYRVCGYRWPEGIK
jgi:uncharacterized protein (TIGR02594 family)